MSNVEGWKKVRICELGTIVTGSTPDTKNDSYWGGEVPFVSPADFKSSAFVEETARTLSNAGVEQARLIPQNSILVTCIGSIGGIAIASCSCVTNQQINSILCAERFDDRFVFYVIQHNISKLIELAGTTTLPIINKSTFGDIKIVLPTFKSEQHQIAAILSTIDTAIEQTEAIIAKQQRIKTGLMQDMLTRGIDEHGNIRSEETHEFKDSPLGRIPVEWGVEKWSQMCSKIQDGTHFSPRTDSSAEFKYITSKNIKFGFLDLSDVEHIDKRQHDKIYKRCDVCLEDILLTKDGANTGNVAINPLNEEFSLLSSVALIRPMKSKLASMFLLQTILSESGQRLIKDAMSGIAITRVTLEIINNFMMKVPPIQEQKNIGQFLAVQDERIKSEANKLAKLRSLKTALMQDLLTGKKRVTTLLEASL